jgi:hypothetical protein
MLRSARTYGLLAVILGAILVSGAVLTAQKDPFLGKWVLNVDKSDFMSPGGADVRERTIEMTAGKDGMIAHKQSTYRVGQDIVTTITGEAKFDGKDYPVIGAAFGQVAFTRMGNTMTRIAKNGGKEVETATYTLSPDGKTLTIVTKGENYGIKYGSTQIFEREAE